MRVNAMAESQTASPAVLVSGAITASPGFLLRRRIIGEVMRALLFLAGSVSVLTTIGILYVLISESAVFFAHVPLKEFLTDTMWTPLFADPHFGILPLVTATLLVSGVALMVAIPLGTVLALYLSEFAPPRLREMAKPVLELLAGVPTVVYGYFALLFVTPMLQKVIPGLSGFNMLSAGLVMGVMIIPYVVSLSEDAMRAVPDSLREGAFALGFSRLRTALRVVLPAALSGITAAYILSMSRAVGETMVVAIAAGQNPNFTFDLREGAATMTAYIVQVSLGDVPHGSLAYQTIFAVGMALFVITLVFNVLGFALRRRFREVY